MKFRNWILAFVGLLGFPLSGESALPNDCVIREWALARDVSDMRPIGVAQKFSSRDVSQVFVFAALNCLVISHSVVVKFERDGRTVHEKQIEIKPANNYRIWTSVAALPGLYRVTFEINGDLLNVDEFAVEP